MKTDEIVELVKKLVSVESVADKPENLRMTVDLIVSIVRKYPGITIERFESNSKPSMLAYYGKQRPKRFKILMNGHVDVVPGVPEQFKPYVKNGRLYGRGAGDMKAATVLMTHIFCELAPKVDYPLGLQIVADEETGGFHGTKYQIDQGVAADFVIIGEGTAPGTLCPEARGICWADVHFTGHSAHGAYPWRGNNAALSAAKFIDKIISTYPVPIEEQWATTVNVASIHTNNLVNNRVPGDAKVSLDIRYLLEDANFISRQSAEHFLSSLLPSASPEITMFEPAYSIDRQNLTLQKLTTAIEKDSGQPVEFVRRYGSSDARFYGSSGTPTVTFGLPDHNIHADGEYIELDWIPRYQKILSNFLKSID